MTDSPTHASESPTAWLRHARSDLALAEAPPPEGVLLELLCYHAQQATEKALKAVILQLTRSEPAYSHSIRRLIRDADLAGSPPAPLTAERAALLTQYAIITRYPADLGEVDEAEWQRAVADARGVVDWAESIIVGINRD